MSEKRDYPVMVGQTYRRVHGPPFWCEVRVLNGDQAMCAMRDSQRDYGVRPVPFDLLHSDEFTLDPASPV